MPKALKLYLTCPHCGWYGAKIFQMVPKPGIEKADPEDLSQWHLICTHCGNTVDQKNALRKFKASKGKYKPLQD